ncbi:putative NBD/HSP70 family sugar kinase/DNA-binding MurR/RpiR family transcriptional regulator [Paenibacillus sp. DS2015]|uniref:ROK family protein n=1 Tax=Paenibacillus sp. DS2015 TaxID=3373917 RepID=UPI003D198F66
MRKFLAVDIGGTLIKYGVLTEDGTFIVKNECPTEASLGGSAILDKVKTFGSKLMDEYEISSVCISTAGQVDSNKGEILYASSLIPEYTGTQLKKELEAYFHLPIEVENDVNCAGLAESWVGTGKDAKSLFCLTIGTGIGGSYILDNKLHTGYSFSAGEIGYIPIEGGQFQELASTRILVRNVARLKGILESEIDGREIFALAANNDEVCIQEINRLVYYLSKGIATIAYMMNPEMIIIGGGITAQKEYLYPLIMEQLKKDIIPTVLDKVKIEIARNLNDAGMIGALRHFLLQESFRPLKSITTILESNTHKLTKREQMIAKFIVLNLESVPNMTISEMSRQINVSEATITRFCQKLEFGSYSKLRLVAKEATVSTRLYEQTITTSMTAVKETYSSMLKKFDTLYESDEILQFKNKLVSAKNICIFGAGEMSLVANQLKYKLMKLGMAADAFSDQYQMEMSTHLLGQGTVVIGLSTSGYAPDIVNLMVLAKEKGAATVGITSQQNSPIADVSDIRLLVPTTDEIEGHSSSISEVSVFYLLDVLFKELQGKDKDIALASSITTSDFPLQN